MQRSFTRPTQFTRICGVGSRQLSKSAGKSNALSRKRSLKTTLDKSRRSVRFRSNDEEFVFEVDRPESALPQGSDVFEKIMKEISDHLETDDVTFSDDVFTETITTPKALGTSLDKIKINKPLKSILKRRISSSRR